MAKKSTKAKVQLGKAVNCSDKCSNYKDCEADGNFSRFMPGIECTDIFLENETNTGDKPDEKPEGQIKPDENTGQDDTNMEKETPLDEPNADGKPETEEAKQYVFPRQGNIKCPGCGLYETVATSTQGIIQWRRCTRAIPVCGKTFKITGREVKVTDCKDGT